MKKQKHISLSITERCNLNCIYCFEKSKSNKVLNFENAISIIDRELNADDNFNSVAIDFMGGEPFLEFDLIRNICEYYWGKPTNRPILFFTTTNGTMVKGSIKEWLEKNHMRFSCALSLDGMKTSHNKNRCNSFDEIDIPFFLSMWPTQKVKAIVSMLTISDLCDNVIFLHQLGFTRIEIKLAYGFDWSNDDLCSKYKNELEKLLDFYTEASDYIPCSLLNLDLKKLLVKDEIVKWCNAGIKTISYDMDGNRYPCRYFQDLRKTGNLSDEEMWAINYAEIQESLEAPCRNCIIRNVCRTCYAQNYELYGSFGRKPMFLCYPTRIGVYYSAKLFLKRYESGKIKDKEIENISEAVSACNKIENAFCNNAWLER